MDHKNLSNPSQDLDIKNSKIESSLIGGIAGGDAEIIQNRGSGSVSKKENHFNLHFSLLTFGSYISENLTTESEPNTKVLDIQAQVQSLKSILLEPKNSHNYISENLTTESESNSKVVDIQAQVQSLKSILLEPKQAYI